jgi:hypothetical protein
VLPVSRWCGATTMWEVGGGGGGVKGDGGGGVKGDGSPAELGVPRRRRRLREERVVVPQSAAKKVGEGAARGSQAATQRRRLGKGRRWKQGGRRRCRPAGSGTNPRVRWSWE